MTASTVCPVGTVRMNPGSLRTKRVSLCSYPVNLVEPDLFLELKALVTVLGAWPWVHNKPVCFIF